MKDLNEEKSVPRFMVCAKEVGVRNDEVRLHSDSVCHHVINAADELAAAGLPHLFATSKLQRNGLAYLEPPAIFSIES